MRLYKPPDDPLAALLLNRRNVTVTTAGGCALVLTTEHLVTIHFFGAAGVRGEPVRTVHHFLCQRPDLRTLYDWRSGWNLTQLGALTEETLSESLYVPVRRLSSATRTKMQEYHRSRLKREKRQPPYTPLICPAVRWIAPHMPDGAFKMLVVLSSYANRYGVCFPNMRTLEEITGHNLHQVRDELDYLEAAGLMRYVARQSRNPITGVFYPDQYQVNPAVLYIREEFRADALAAVNQAFAAISFPQDPFSIEETTRFKNRGDLNRNHQWEPQPVNQPNQATLLTTTTKSQRPPQNEVGRGAAVDYANHASANGAGRENAESKSKGGATSANGAAARSANPAPNGADTPPGSGAPPSRSKGRYEVPLSDNRLEALAHEVRELAPTRLWQARELVDTYSSDDIRQGLLHLARAQQKGSTREPFGLLKWWLGNNIIRAEADAPEMLVTGENDGSKYVSGKYGKYVQH